MSTPEGPGSERRGAKRHVAELEVQYRSVGKTVVHSTRDLSSTGVFLSCKEPTPLGTRLELALAPPGQRPLTLEGEVVRVVWGGRDRGRAVPPGMAVRFVNHDEDRQDAVSRLLKTLG